MRTAADFACAERASARSVGCAPNRRDPASRAAHRVSAIAAELELAGDAGLLARRERVAGSALDRGCRVRCRAHLLYGTAIHRVADDELAVRTVGSVLSDECCC